MNQETKEKFKKIVNEYINQIEETYGCKYEEPRYGLCDFINRIFYYQEGVLNREEKNIFFGLIEKLTGEELWFSPCRASAHWSSDDDRTRINKCKELIKIIEDQE